MKKKYYFLSIVLYLLTIPFVCSQNINQEYIFTKDAFTKINTVLNVGENTFIGGSIASCKTGSIGIITHGNDYQSLENIEPGQWAVNDMELRTVDNTIIGSGYWYEADDIAGTNNRPYVFGMDINANILFSKHLTELGDGAPAVVNNTNVYLTHTASENIVIAFRKDIVWLDNVGEFQSEISYAFESDFENINRFNDDVLFAYTKRELLLISHTGEEIDLINSNTDILDVYADDENIYCLRTNDILVYNVSSNTTSSSNDYLNSISDAKGIAGNNNSLFLYQKGIYNITNGADEIIQMNKSDLSVVDNLGFTFNKEETNIELILATENDLQILGKESNFQPFIKSKAILDELVFDDLEIEVLSITTMGEIMIVDSITSGPNIYYEMEGNIPYEFVVKNNNEEKIIHSFSMTGNNLGGVNCSVWLYFDHYDNLSIPPGESMVFTGSVNFTGHYIHPPAYNLPEIHVSVFGPNNRFDKDLSNNSMSSSVIITDTKELHSLTTDWQVYPNPVKDNIHFNASLKEKSDHIEITIYNSIGEEVKQIIPNVNHLEIQEQISVNYLPNGLYFLNLSTRKGNETRSIIINR